MLKPDYLLSFLSMFCLPADFFFQSFISLPDLNPLWNIWKGFKQNKIFILFQKWPITSQEIAMVFVWTFGRRMDHGIFRNFSKSKHILLTSKSSD